jgi:hypothetical protein
MVANRVERVLAKSLSAGPDPLPNVDTPIDHNVRQRRVVAASLFTAVAVGIIVMAPSWRARFGPIDDHEPLRWMGRDGRLQPSEAWSAFYGDTEVGRWGDARRFRPAYYAFRVTQTVLFGDNVRLWYLSVFVLFCATCLALGYMVSLWFDLARARSRPDNWSVAIAVAATLIFAGMRAWSGVVGRLGPSEQLGLCAAALALLALTKLSSGRTSRWWIVAVAGITVAVFAKETFAPICALGPVVGVYRYVRYDRRRRELIAGISACVPTALLAVVLGPAIVGGGDTDVYGRSAGTTRISGALHGLLMPTFSFWLATVVLVPTVAAAAWFMLDVDRATKVLLVSCAAWLVSAVLADAWLNAGDYWAPRYRAVLDLVCGLQTLACAAVVVAIIRKRSVRIHEAFLVGACGLAVLGLAVMSFENLDRTRDVVERNMLQTISYDEDLRQVLSALDAHAERPVAVVLYYGFDYEPANATLQELWRRAESPRPQFLVLGVPAGFYPALDEVQQHGSDQWHAGPYRDLLNGHDAVCAFLNARPDGPVPGCAPGLGVRVDISGM